MVSPETVKLLAKLVHRGLLGVDAAQQAMASGDPRGWLVARGHVDDAQWRRWQQTDGGTRPVLSRYTLGDLLGEGGTARVFRATDKSTGEECALKVLKEELAGQRAALAQFVREAQLLVDIDSPYIVKGKRVAKEGSVFFCAMEIVAGECLLDRLDRDGPLDEQVALNVVVQVARALEYLHGRGLVHRDVKPGNILLAESGRAVLIDLGFAAGKESQGEQEAETTAGTVHYIAPEQARGQVDARADIYALGATLYHLVTGAPPFTGTSSEDVLRKQVLEALSGERIRTMGLAPQTHYFIEKMMAKELEIRFQSPAEVAEEVAAWLAQRAGQDEPAAGGPKAPRRRRRRRLF